MLEGMELEEYLDWQAYERIEPFEPQRADIRSAAQTAVMVNMQIPRGKPKSKTRDFMIRYDDKYLDKPKQDAAELQAAFMACIGGKTVGR